MHHDQKRPARDLDNRRDVRDWIEAKLVETRRNCVAVGDQRQGIAVGRRLDPYGLANRSSCAWLVLNDELLAERLAQALGNKARDEVVATAWREPDDYPHRFGRVLLRGCRRRYDQHSRAGKRRVAEPSQYGHAASPRSLTHTIYALIRRPIGPS